MHTEAHPDAAVILHGSRDVKYGQKGFLAVSLLIVASILAVALDRPPRPVSAHAPLSDFSAERAAKHLAVISRAPHPVGSPEHDRVRDYIVGTLRHVGLTPHVQRSTNLAKSDRSTGVLENIVCRLPGRVGGKAVLVAAHYDSVAAGPGASDDGVAVAAFLEATRLLKSLPQLRRDVIILFTDGEEPGMLGAQAFVTEHPWAHDIGLVLNFDARGNSGPSIMFETSDNNGWLISKFRRAASHPVATSLSYEIYKRLPNDTDFTIFRRAGYSGLNFAFIDGLAYYHTARDSIANANLGSLQHDGDYLLELTRHFGNTVSDDPKQPDAVYFDVLGWVLISYSPSTGILLLGLSGTLVSIVFFLGVRRKYVRFRSCMLGLTTTIAGVAIAVAAAGIASWLTFTGGHIVPAIHSGLMYHSGLYISACSAIGLACATGFYSFAARWTGAEALSMGALIAWCVLAVALCICIPGAAYLFVWPLLFSSFGWLILFAKWHASGNVRILILLLTGIAAIVILVPTSHKIFFAFASESALMVTGILGLLLALVIGQILHETMSSRLLLPAVFIAAGAALFVAAIAISAVDNNGSQSAQSLVDIHTPAKQTAGYSSPSKH